MNKKHLKAIRRKVSRQIGAFALHFFITRDKRCKAAMEYTIFKYSGIKTKL